MKVQIGIMLVLGMVVLAILWSGYTVKNRYDNGVDTGCSDAITVSEKYQVFDGISVVGHVKTTDGRDYSVTLPEVWSKLETGKSYWVGLSARTRTGISIGSAFEVTVTQHPGVRNYCYIKSVEGSDWL
jgi:hypothetical protein